MLLDLTERERLVITFALSRFAATARDRFDTANQKSTILLSRMPSPFDAIEAAKFLQDAKDAEALIDRLRATNTKEAP